MDHGRDEADTREGGELTGNPLERSVHPPSLPRPAGPVTLGIKPAAGRRCGG